MSAGDETPEQAPSAPPTPPTPPPPATSPTSPAPAAPQSPPVVAAAPTPPTPPTAEALRTAAADGLQATAAPEPPPTSSGEEPPRQAAADVPGPKMVRRVVVSYRLGWLPGDWLQTWRRLDRVFARAELNVKATLAPLEDLPIDTDILVVPPDLREAAKEAAMPGTPILVTPASAAAGAFADLVSRLKAGTEFTAEAVDPAAKDKPKIVSNRGHTLLD